MRALRSAAAAAAATAAAARWIGQGLYKKGEDFVERTLVPIDEIPWLADVKDIAKKE